MEANTNKRLDVGYKRPPVEHQFKPGQKPPPRKAKSAKLKSKAQLLAKILREEVRVEIGGKVRWCTKAELLVLIAFRLAEGGNASVARALTDFLLAQEDPVEWEETWMQIGHPERGGRLFRVDSRTGMPLEGLKA
jgi:hypothetical protein